MLRVECGPAVLRVDVLQLRGALSKTPVVEWQPPHNLCTRHILNKTKDDNLYMPARYFNESLIYCVAPKRNLVRFPTT